METLGHIRGRMTNDEARMTNAGPGTLVIQISSFGFSALSGGGHFGARQDAGDGDVHQAGELLARGDQWTPPGAGGDDSRGCHAGGKETEGQHDHSPWAAGGG